MIAVKRALENGSVETVRVRLERGERREDITVGALRARLLGELNGSYLRRGRNGERLADHELVCSVETIYLWP